MSNETAKIGTISQIRTSLCKAFVIENEIIVLVDVHLSYSSVTGARLALR